MGYTGWANAFFGQDSLPEDCVWLKFPPLYLLLPLPTLIP